MDNLASRNGTVDFLIPGLLGLAWVACVVIINPIGDFPTNDDWAYGLPVEVLLRDHALRFTDWQAASLAAQVFWGALFCLPGGFSFTALRISSLTLGLVGVISMYLLLRHLGAGRRIATFGTAVLAFNPYYLFLAHSFMTDIPFLALMILAMLLLLRGVDLDRGVEVIIGLILACLSIFIRQIGLFVLIALLLAYPLRRGFGRRWVLVAVIPTVGSAFLLWVFMRYLDLIGELPGAFARKSDGVKEFWADVAHGNVGAFTFSLRISFLLLMYVGLWTLPFSLLIAPRALARLARASRRAAWMSVAAATAGVTLLLTLCGWLMPMTGNQLNNLSMGLISLPGAPQGLPRPFWIGITALAALGAALSILILGVLAHEKWSTRGQPPTHESWSWRVVFLLVVGVLNLGPVVFTYAAGFDRYYLVFVPLLLALIVALAHGQDLSAGRLVEWLPASLMAVYLVFGVAATHDYLAWNRARWAVAADLHERWGIPKEEIDGGFEYNNLLDSRERLRTRWIHRPGVVQSVKNPSRPCRLAFEPIAGYEILSHVECRPWLPWGSSRVYGLRQFPAGPPKASPERARMK